MGKGIVLLKVMRHAAIWTTSSRSSPARSSRTPAPTSSRPRPGTEAASRPSTTSSSCATPSRVDRCQGFRRHRFRRGRGGHDRGRRGQDRHRARGRDHERLLEAAAGLVTPHDDVRERWPERRFSQAISEGDGISVIPCVRGRGEAFAGLAEAAGAEGLAVETIEQVRLCAQATELPLLLRGADRATSSRCALPARPASMRACSCPGRCRPRGRCSRSSSPRRPSSASTGGSTFVTRRSSRRRSSGSTRDRRPLRARPGREGRRSSS